MSCRDRNKVYQYGLVSSVCLLLVLVGIVVALVVMEVIVLDFTSHKNGTDTKSLDEDLGSDETPLDPPVRKNVTSTSFNGNKTRRTRTTTVVTTVATTMNIITSASACGNGWIDATQVELGCLWIERHKDFIQEKKLDQTAERLTVFEFYKNVQFFHIQILDTDLPLLYKTFLA